MKTTHPHSRLVLCVVGMCLVLAASPLWAADATAPSSVLSLAPANASAIFLIPSLSQLSQKLSQVNDTLSLNSRPLSDALTEFKSDVSIARGVRDEGSLMVILMGGADAQSGLPAALVFMPVNDYGAFIGNFGGVADHKIAELKLPGNRTGYARRFEGMAVMSPSRELLESYQPASPAVDWVNGAGKLSGPYIDSSDVVVLLNIESMAPKLTALIGNWVSSASAAAQAHPMAPGAAGQAPGPEAMSAAAAKATSDLLAPAAGILVRDTHMMMIAADVGDDGFGLTIAAQFKPGSPLATAFTTGGQTGTLLAHMPNQPYLLATAIRCEGLPWDKITQALSAMFPGGPLATTMDLISREAPLYASADGYANVLYTPQGPGTLGSSLLEGLTAVETNDTTAYIASLRNFITGLNGVKVALPGAVADPNAGGDVPQLVYNSTYAPNTMQIAGTNVDEYQIQYNMPPQAPQPMGQIAPFVQMFEQTLGNGPSGYITSSDNYVLKTSVSDAQLLDTGMAASKQDGGLGADLMLNKVRDRLTPKPFVESYLNITGVVRTMNQFDSIMNPAATAVTPATPATAVPPEQAPVGVSASLQDSGIVGRLYLPVSVVRYFKDTLAAMIAAQMGAGQPGAVPPQAAPPGQGQTPQDRYGPPR